LTGWEKQKELARYRVQQAEESLEASKGSVLGNK